MIKTILTDADGVLLDWEVDFNKWMEKHGYEKKCLVYMKWKLHMDFLKQNARS